MDAKQYDAIIIGAGQAGVPLSSAMANQGWKTALVERDKVGGTCINWGCTPTKTMIASARAAYLARRGANYGVMTGPIAVDLRRVRERKRERVQASGEGVERRVLDAGVDLVHGEASFSPPTTPGMHAVAVRMENDQTARLEAPRVFIDTGARPALPEFPGLEDGLPWYDSTAIMEIDQVPGHLIVVGGGYVGLEFAQMFHRFGSRVTIVQRSRQLLSREDEDVAQAMAEILREDGIEVLLSTAVLSAARGQNGGVTLHLRGSEGERTLEGTHLLLASGRTPNTAELNLSAAGVAVDEKGRVPVNERLETNVPGIFALGDVKGGPAFTHISYDDYRIICANLLQSRNGHAPASISGRMVPYVVFTDPQLGRVGLNEREARARGLDIQVAKIPMSWVARALEVDEARGFMKAIIDRASGQILGFTGLGIEAGEIMAMVELAMMGNLHYATLRDAVFAHPTLAEGLNTLFSFIE